MNFKKILPYFPLILALVLVFLMMTEKDSLDVIEEVDPPITREEIVEMLKTDEVGLAFLENYDGFKIERRELLSKEEIERRAIEGDYKEIYEDLSLEDDRYVMIRIAEREKNRGLVGTLDMEASVAVSLYNLFLINFSQ